MANNDAPWLSTALASLIQQKLGANASTGSGGLTLSVPAPSSSQPTVTLDGVKSDTNGINGHLHIDGLGAQTLKTELFGGFEIALTSLDLMLLGGGFSSSTIVGQLTVPYFTNSDNSKGTIDVELAIRHDGSLSLTLAAQQSDPNKMTPDGQVKLVYSIGAGVTIELDIASLELDQSGSTTQIVIGGQLIITTEGLNWPSFEFTGLRIDSQGHVELDGGWIDLPSQTALDYFGFHVGLQKLGFGNDPSGRWIAFNGDIHLVEGIPLGGSVRGLRLNLENGAVEFSGVDVAFEIPDVLKFEGTIDHIQVNASTSNDVKAAGLPATLFDAIPGPTPKQINVFAGAVDVVIYPAGELEVDAQFIVGNFGGISVFFLALDAELPVGIPIFIDVSLYGIEGLFSSNLRPDPSRPDSHNNTHTWWEWYKYPSDPNRNYDISIDEQPDYTAIDVNKWLSYPEQGAFALGAGATIGTSVDDGYAVSAAISFVLILPGPVISFMGKAKILSKRVSNRKEADDSGIGASFDAMATYDGGAGTFDLDIDARYQIPVILDIEASAVLHVDTQASGDDADKWYFALGLPPHDKRVKARIFDLFETDAYFVISNRGLITGAYIGYRNEWDFGPLSVSINAYLAMLAAIQWSPLVIGGGIELHGEVHLEAFGIGLGITADALLEGRAPDPFWVHGEFSVHLDTPWPLPDVGATVSLEWGGNNDHVPPVPLALSHVDATLVDHVASSDRYTLLTHRPNWPSPDPNVQLSDSAITYADPSAPGILQANPKLSDYWGPQVGNPPDDNKVLQVLPDLVPDAPSNTQFAPVIPQDAHFTLSFAHPTQDLAGFANGASPVPTEPPVGNPPANNALPEDDMSHLNLNPPQPNVQWIHTHKLRQVALYMYIDGQGWQPVASHPTYQVGNDPNNTTKDLPGAWLPSPTKPTVNSPDNSQLKVTPSIFLLPGPEATAQWQDSSGTPGMHFNDQGLQFDLEAGLNAAHIDSPWPGMPTGMIFSQNESSTTHKVSISFPQPVQILSIESVVIGPSVEFRFSSPDWLGDGSPLSFSESVDPTSQVRTQSITDTRKISQLSVDVFNETALFSITWKLPDIKLNILPQAPAFYALKTVSEIDSSHTDGSNAQQDYPVIEFAYFQTASGPAIGVIDTAWPDPQPIPAVPPPYPKLADNVPSPASAFPKGGQLLDLHTYTQWSWPEDGNVAAYYGYDVNIEFDETYVNALYAGSVDARLLVNSLHFRCVDRNHNHVFFVPLAIHVPSMYQQSALVGADISLHLPKAIDQGTGGNGTVITTSHSALAMVRVALQPQARRFEQEKLLGRPVNLPSSSEVTLTGQPLIALQQVAARANIALDPKEPGNVGLISISASAAVILAILEEEAAQQARALWPQTLQPRTRYTLDIVAGPFNREIGDVPSTRLANAPRTAFVAGSLNRDSREATIAGLGDTHKGSLAAIYDPQQDAIGVLHALQDYYAYEDSLTTLQRVQFTTSRYKTFTEHIANAVEQSRIDSQIDPSRPDVAPIQQYTAQIDAQAWLADPSHSTSYTDKQTAYLNARSDLANFVGTFDPTADDLSNSSQQQYLPLPPAPPPHAPLPWPPTDWHPAGQSGLRAKRDATQQAWQDFTEATSALFDELVTALLGRPDFVSNQHLAPPPDTELSRFVNSNGRVQALFIHSPEPLPWRRLWQYVTLMPADAQELSLNVIALWSTDGTRALLIPQDIPGTSTISVSAARERAVTGLAAANEIDSEATVIRRVDALHPRWIAPSPGGIVLGGGGVSQPPPTGKYILVMHFQGNIGAEAPCITLSDANKRGVAISERVQFAPLVIIPPPPQQTQPGGPPGNIPH